jgi:cyclophilin family peptidyl-prolyl cis-trans isomerase/HEAT repeat protein
MPAMSWFVGPLRFGALLIVLAAPPAAAQKDPVAEAFREIAVAEDARNATDGVLTRHLWSDLAPVRARAALAMGRVQDTSTVAALVTLLSDARPEVRLEAAFALGQIGHRSAGEALAGALADPSLDVAGAALEALGKLGEKRWTARVTPFLRHGLARMRGEAAVALWRLGDTTALAPLLAAHQDQDPEVRWRVLWALEKIVAPDRIVHVAASHLSDPDPTVRTFAARTLGRQRSPRALPYLCTSINEPDVNVVVNAVRALQAIGDTTSCPSLARLVAHPHPYVRVTTATAIAELAWVGGADSLAAHLRDGDPASRGACARGLLKLGRERALPLVQPVLGDSSVYARAGALDGLRFLPARASVARLREGMGEERHLLERITCAAVAGEAGVRDALDLLRRGLAQREAPFAAACAEAVTALRDRASLPEVAAAYALHVRSSDPDARIALSAALDSLGGRAYADSVRRAHPVGAATPPPSADELAARPGARGAILRTTAGDMEWEFQVEEAPQTVKNFIRLAERGYFDGRAFHRVVPAFVIQDGDTTGTGWGGPGYTIRCEYNRLRYDPGMVGMALSGKDTGGSQWFITHTPQMHLNGRYTIFARVIRGKDVVQRVVQGDRVTKVELVR